MHNSWNNKSQYDKVVITAGSITPKRQDARSPRQKASTSDNKFPVRDLDCALTPFLIDILCLLNRTEEFTLQINITKQDQRTCLLAVSP